MSVPARQLEVCHHCGAQNPADADKCWLCQADRGAVEAILVAEVVPQRPGYAPAEWFFAITSLVLLGLLVLVGVGAFLEEPVWGVIYAVLVMPPLMATALRAQYKRAVEGHVTWAERFATFVISAAVTVSVVVLLGVGAFVAFFVYCMVVITKELM